MSLLIIFIAVLNLSSNSVLPIVFEACTICLNNSSNRLIHLTIEPSNISVILQRSLKELPLHQLKTTSIKNGLNLSTQVSSSNGKRASVLTLAILLAKSFNNIFLNQTHYVVLAKKKECVFGVFITDFISKISKGKDYQYLLFE